MGNLLRSSMLGVVLAVAPVIVLAQQSTKEYPECTRQPTDSDIAAAKGAFQAGQVSFNEADYDRAITYWEDAYRRDCTAHPMLLNLARAYELDGNLQQAVVSLETFIARNPSSPQREQIAKRVEVLKEKIASQPASTETSGPTTTSTAPPPPTTTATGVTPDQPPPGQRPIWPLFVAGGGVVVAAVGGILYLGATSDYNDARDKCGGTQNCPDEVTKQGNEAADRQRRWGIVTGVGVAIAAGGVVYYFLQKPEAPANKAQARRRTNVSPELGPGYAGVSLSGSF